MVATLFAEQALLPDGWARNVAIEITPEGTIASVKTGASAEGAQRASGPVLPGMVNLHSHAFQRAMAGLTEVALKPDDSFWSWRELMYRLVGRLQPDQVVLSPVMMSAGGLAISSLIAASTPSESSASRIAACFAC